jgi:hypothetical protein
MKRLIPSLLLLAAFGLVARQLTACRKAPTPPTVEDAIAVWKNTHANPHLTDLVCLKKTNGQMQKSNGALVYPLYYEAVERSVIRHGNSTAGTIDKYQGNYPFQWTENGWIGPDHHVYPAH